MKKKTPENQILKKIKKNLVTQIIQNTLIKMQKIPQKTNIKSFLLLKVKKNLRIEKDQKIFLLKNIKILKIKN